MNNIDWTSLLIGASPFLIGLILKFLIDIKLWPPLIVILSSLKVPVKRIYGEDPPNLRGEWDVEWESKSENFPDPKDRHKCSKVYQYSTFIYATYAGKDRRYCMTGKIEERYLTGVWYDKKDKLGYRGAFQLRIVNSSIMKGRWLGFSSTSEVINSDSYTWTKNPD